MIARLKLLIILAGILCAFAMGYLWFEPWIELKVLERQAKKNLDAVELQEWAMKLIARHPSETTTFQQYYGTNFQSNTSLPSGLGKIDLFLAGVNILTDNRGVAIFGLRKGGPFLEVVAPSLPARTNHSVIQWKSGIYFVGE